MLLETIKIENGKPQRLNFHNERMNRSRHKLLYSSNDIYLEDFITVPYELRSGIVKCRVLYAHDILKMEYFPYQINEISEFILVETQIDYRYKFSNRLELNYLKSRVPASSEIIMVKNDLITDTSYSNLIFKNKEGKWLTPETPLLEGTQREFLLSKRIIDEAEISVKDLKNFTHFMMINSMLEFDEKRVFPMEMIKSSRF